MQPAGRQILGLEAVSVKETGASEGSQTPSACHRLSQKDAAVVAREADVEKSKKCSVKELLILMSMAMREANSKMNAAVNEVVDVARGICVSGGLA